MPENTFVPKLFTLIKRGIPAEQVRKDVLAGLTVGIVALPLAIAFAIASGVPPEKGLLTAIVGGIVISVLGGSRVQIGGPTGAFIVIVYAIVQQHGLNGLVIATFMAGFLMMGMGWARLGNYLKFIPYPLIVGFTSGIAVIIFTSQVRDLMGLPIATLPADFVEKLRVYAGTITEVNWLSASIGLGSIGMSALFIRLRSRIPGSIVAIIISTLVVWAFGLPVDTIESRFGDISSGFSMPAVPTFTFATLQSLVQPAIAIALLGGIESLLSAVVADGMIGGRHRSNMELVAQGAANIMSGLFGGIPATGAIARTATNIQSGGRTPIAGITHAIVLLLIMLVLAPVAKLIPLSCLAGVLVMISWHMFEWKNFVAMLRSNRMDVLVLVVTFVLTIFFDLVLAIEVGIVLSSFIFLEKMSNAAGTTVMTVRASDATESDVDADQLFDEEIGVVPDGIVVFEVTGPLFFGAAKKFQDVITSLNKAPRVLIVRMRNVPFVDATGVNSLREICEIMTSKGTVTVISGANHDVRAELLRSGLYQQIGKHNIHNNISNALARAKVIIAAQAIV